MTKYLKDKFEKSDWLKILALLIIIGGITLLVNYFTSQIN